MRFTIAAAASLLIAAVSAAPSIVEERGLSLYTPTFLAKGCATQAPDYLTYSIQLTPGKCFAFCDSIPACKFVNYYQDLAANKDYSGIVYTCAAFSKVHGIDSTLSNCGQQNQVAGSPFKNTIINSNGFKKN